MFKIEPSGFGGFRSTANCIIIAPKRRNFGYQGQLENHRNGFETRRFRPFWLELSRFITQRRETGRPIPVQMQKNGQLLCNSQEGTSKDGVW
jgi:hypothetical protein